MTMLKINKQQKDGQIVMIGDKKTIDNITLVHYLKNH